MLLDSTRFKPGFPALIAPASLKRANRISLVEGGKVFSGVNRAGLIEALPERFVEGTVSLRFPALIAPASLKRTGLVRARRSDRKVFRR